MKIYIVMKESIDKTELIHNIESIFNDVKVQEYWIKLSLENKESVKD